MKYRIKSLDEVAENLRDLYVADGDEFVLKLDDDTTTLRDCDTITVEAVHDNNTQ